MAKLTDLTEVTTLADGDLAIAVDVSNTSMDATGTNSKVTLANVYAYIKAKADSVYATIGHNHTGVYAPVLGSDDNYVTDAQLVVIGNTSGTNTGDNATNSQYSGLASSKAEVAGSTSQAFSVSQLEVSNTDTTITRNAAGVLAVEGVVIPSISSTNTLTNKRVTPRAGTTTSSATPTINTDNYDYYSLTAQTVDITSFTTNLTGTPTDGQKLWISITGTAARAITWGASFESSTVTLPTTTVTTARLDVGFVWNTATSKWRCVAVS